MIYSTFNEYLTKPKSLTFEEMQELHDMILTDISGDMDGIERKRRNAISEGRPVMIL